MNMPDFPNGFASWQKTHFEVVEVLCYIRDKHKGFQPRNFTEAADQSATEDQYQLALSLTNQYEALTKGKPRERSLFDDIEDFVFQQMNATKN